MRILVRKKKIMLVELGCLVRLFHQMSFLKITIQLVKFSSLLTECNFCTYLYSSRYALCGDNVHFVMHTSLTETFLFRQFPVNVSFVLYTVSVYTLSLRISYFVIWFLLAVAVMLMLFVYRYTICDVIIGVFVCDRIWYKIDCVA